MSQDALDDHEEMELETTLRPSIRDREIDGEDFESDNDDAEGETEDLGRGLLSRKRAETHSRKPSLILNEWQQPGKRIFVAGILFEVLALGIHVLRCSMNHSRLF